MGSTTLLYRFVGLDAGAGAEFDKMAGKTALLGKSSGALKSGLIGLGAATAATAGVVAVESVKMAAGFQTSMLRIQTQANDSKAHVAQLSQGILQMAGDVATTPAVLSDAAYHIASVGQGALNTAQQLRVLKIAAEGAKIGGANLTDVTNALDGAIVSGIRGAQDYSKAMGVLNATVGAGDMSMQDLADAIGSGVTVTAKQAGVSLKQLGAGLAVLGDNNIRGARAGNAMRMAIQAMEKPASTAAAGLKELGLNTGQLNKDMQQGGLPKALADLKTHMQAAGDTGKKVGAILTDIFGKKAGAGIGALVGEYGRFNNKLTEVGKGATGFASSWATYNKSFQAGLDGAKAAGEALLITLGDKLLPVATKLMDWIRTSAIPAIQGLMDGFSGTGGSASSLSPILDLVKSDFSAVAGVVKSVTATVRAHKAQLEELGQFIKSVIIPVLKIQFKQALTEVKVALKVLITAISAGVDAFNAIRSAAHAVASFFSGPFAGAFKTAAHALTSAYNTMVHATSAAVSKIVGFFRKLPGEIKSTLAGLGHALFNIGVQVMEGLISGLASKLSSLTSMVGSIANKLTGGLAGHLGIHSPSTVTRKFGQNVIDGLTLGMADRQKSLIDAVTAQMTALISKAKALSSQLRDALVGGADLSNLQIVKNGPADQTGSYLSAYARQLKVFIKDLTVLRNNGLSSVIVDQIANLGATAGLPVVKDILGNFRAHGVKQRIGEINTSEKQILSLSKGYADKQSTFQYGDPQDAKEMIRLAKQQSGQLDKIIKELQQNAHDTAAALNNGTKGAAKKAKAHA